MAGNETYADFLKYSEEINININDLTKATALLNNSISTSLFSPEPEVKNYITKIDDTQRNISTTFQRILAIGAMAFQNINSSFSSISNQINSFSDSMDLQTQETHELILTLEDRLKEQEETIHKLNQTIFNLTELIKPPKLTRDHVENAKYLIENVKNNVGKSIKSASITIPNVQAILMEYDRLKSFSDNESLNNDEPEMKPTKRRINTNKK